MSIHSGVGSIRELGGGVVPPDDDVLHVLDLGAALVGNLGQGSEKNRSVRFGGGAPKVNYSVSRLV